MFRCLTRVPHPGRLFLSIGSVCLLCAFCTGLSPETSSSLRASSPPVAANAVGAGSCSASGCHGAPREQGIKGSEYSVWAASDKHASAYSVLFTERSRQIELALTHSKNLRGVHPENDALCLRCHGLAGALGHAELQMDGVSCEACHGPAKQWLAQHYLPEWKSLSSEARHAIGFIDTRDLLQRGKACATCHIGDGDREVNHDLLAAGHPRLAFEYSAYLALEAKHWNDAGERKQYADFELRTWALGQILSAQTALELLAVRAGDNKRPWPEFAEYDCFACHHDLKSKSWRAAQGFPGRQPGSPDWGGWYTTLLPTALAASGAKQGKEIDRQIAQIHQIMNGVPRRQEIATAARAAAQALESPARRLAEETSQTGQLESLLDALLHPNDNRTDLTWDQATQKYLGLAAAINAVNDSAPSRMSAEFQQRARAIADLLRFPGGPKNSNWFDSPSNFDPVRVQQAFRDLGSSSSR
jgi:hypothetical protein